MMNYYESAKGIELENCVFSFVKINKPNKYYLIDIGVAGIKTSKIIPYSELYSFFNGKNTIIIRFLKKKGYAQKLCKFKTEKGFVSKVKNNRK